MQLLNRYIMPAFHNSTSPLVGQDAWTCDTNPTVVSCDKDGRVYWLRVNAYAHEKEYPGGFLSTYLGALSHLYELDVSGYYETMTGVIPSELGAATQLELLSLANAALTGTLPMELFRSGCQLRYLTLTNVAVNGTIPPALGTHCTNLTLFESYRDNAGSLNLANNPRYTFAGSIPSTFVRLTKLKSLTLDGNAIAGPLFDVCALKQLETLDIAVAGVVYGTDNVPYMPSCFAALRHLQSLRLTGGFAGTLATELGTLRRLTSIDVSVGAINGTIPSELGQLNLTSLSVSNNVLLSGSLPTELGRLTALSSLTVDGCQLGGVVPSQLASLPLATLWLARNHFVGELPSFTGGGIVGGGSALASFSCEENALSGSLIDKIPLSVTYCTVFNGSLVGETEFNCFNCNEMGLPPQCFIDPSEPDDDDEQELNPCSARSQAWSKNCTIYGTGATRAPTLTLTPLPSNAPTSSPSNAPPAAPTKQPAVATRAPTLSPTPTTASASPTPRNSGGGGGGKHVGGGGSGASNALVVRSLIALSVLLVLALVVVSLLFIRERRRQRRDAARVALINE